MKLKLPFLLALLFFSADYLLAQTPEHFLCATVEDPQDAVYFSPFNVNNPVYSGSVDPVVLATYPPISFDIYFWIIYKDEGDDSNELIISDNDIALTLSKVNEYYKPLGICFILKGIGYIYETEIYADTNFYSVSSYAQANNHVITNTLNVYLPRSLYRGNGVTTLGNNKLIVTQPNVLGIWGTMRGNALAHEIAHDFNLRHPWGEGNNVTITPEHVTRDQNNSNYNALTVADRVHDTPAMASFHPEEGQGTIIR